MFSKRINNLLGGGVGPIKWQLTIRPSYAGATFRKRPEFEFMRRVLGNAKRQETTQPRRREFFFKCQECTVRCRSRAELWLVTIDPKQMSGDTTFCLDILVADTNTYPSRSGLDNSTILNV
jgi:hypothetical protein